MGKEVDFSKYNFIIFSDVDGTLNLKDERLPQIVEYIEKSSGLFVPITGRTIGDIKNKFIKNNIKLPEIIIGDNGGGVYHTLESEFLELKKLDNRIVKQILHYCKEQNISEKYIRFTDGERIYISDDSDVVQYYKQNNTVKICSDIKKVLLGKEDITKITLVGTKENMKEINSKLLGLQLWGHVDKTKFPIKEQNNYRIDITGKEISKGNAVKKIHSMVKPSKGYIVIGNGYNDKSMFEQAVDDKMFAIVIDSEEEKELISEIQEYSKLKCGKALVAEVNENLANDSIMHMAKFFKKSLQKHDDIDAQK